MSKIRKKIFDYRIMIGSFTFINILSVVFFVMIQQTGQYTKNNLIKTIIRKDKQT
jgi:hypothetical protein